jgi:murein L,D-transpeptidase YafK
MLRWGVLLAIAIVIGLATAVIAISWDGGNYAPLPAGAKADRVVVEKKAHSMTLYEDNRVLRRYAVALGRGGPEPKTREGDNRVPEGAYRIDARNPKSAFDLSLHISYPQAKDVEQASARGEQPGSNIMIHGIRNGFGWVGAAQRKLDWTAGCIALTDDEIEEVWRVVPDGTPIEIRP